MATEFKRRVCGKMYQFFPLYICDQSACQECIYKISQKNIDMEWNPNSPLPGYIGDSTKAGNIYNGGHYTVCG